MQLQRRIARQPRHLGVPVLARCGLVGGQFAAHVARDRPVDVGPADLQLGLDVGQGEAGVLKFDHLLAERAALAGERHRLVERALRRRLRRDRDRQPLLRQVADEVDEPAVFLADQVARRHPHIVEEQLGRVGHPLPDFVQIAPARKAGPVPLDQHQRSAPGPGTRIGLGHGDDHVGVLAVGDIGLGPVDHVFVAVAPRGGAHALQIGTRARLGHRNRGNRLAGQHARQPARLQFVAGIAQHIRHRDIALQRQAVGHHRISEFLVEDRVEGEIQPWAAPFLGHCRAQQSGIAGLAPEIARDDTIFLEFCDARRKLPLNKAANRIAKRAVVFAVDKAMIAIKHPRFLIYKYNMKFAYKIYACYTRYSWFSATPLRRYM